MPELHTTGRGGSINRVLESHFPKITARAAREAPNAVERTLYRMQAIAQAHARVLTGFMRGEIEVLHAPGAMEGEMIGGANYTIYHELGTRYMSAQPMFGPAAEEAYPLLLADVHACYRVR